MESVTNRAVLEQMSARDTAVTYCSLLKPRTQRRCSHSCGVFANSSAETAVEVWLVPSLLPPCLALRSTASWWAGYTVGCLGCRLFAHGLQLMEDQVRLCLLDKTYAARWIGFTLGVTAAQPSISVSPLSTSVVGQAA